MPEYTFRCEKCLGDSFLYCSIAEYDDKFKKFKCHQCGSKKVYRLYDADDIYGTVKEIKTVAQLAEANEKKYGKELTAKMREEHKTKRVEGMKQLPQGMSRIRKAEDFKDTYSIDDWKKKGKIK